MTANLVRDNLSLNKVPVYSDAEPDQQHQHNTEWRDCKIRRKAGEATYKRGGETYKRGGTPGGESRLNFLAKLPHHPPRKLSTCPTSSREIKILRTNFEKRASTSHVKSFYVSAYINFDV